MTLEQLLIKFKNENYRVSVSTDSDTWHVSLFADNVMEDFSFETIAEMKEWMEENLPS